MHRRRPPAPPVRPLLWLGIALAGLTLAGCGPVSPSVSADQATGPADGAARDGAAPDAAVTPTPVRVATFNSALERATAGALRAELEAGSAQAQAVAAIVQRVRPDVLVLQEFDYDPAALALFQSAYLNAAQAGGEPIDYPYAWAAPSNTGQPSGVDLDNDGATDGPGDALGFGRHPGHYAFAVLSRYPLQPEALRSFRTLKWRDLPGALLPQTADGPYYSDAALAVLPLSSKNHVDLPVALPGGVVHLLIAHPTPPVFDGPEDRNGRRNHDEIRLWADYLDPSKGQALVDDAGAAGGLPVTESFVILGDYNADPVDGDSYQGAINQLLAHPRVNPAVATGAQVPRSPGAAAQPLAQGAQGEPAHHTAGWGLRVDYALPSLDLVVTGSGVFWPAEGEPGADLVGEAGAPPRPISSDHRLVWVDLLR